MRAQLTGFRAFVLIWFGQFISLIGSGMTTFAFTIWAYQETGSATALALVAFFGFGPTIILSPVAGALVDRWDRKLVMMMTDLAAGLTTIALLFLYATGRLEIWHLYVAGAISGSFGAFQFPAFSAAITLMVSKEQYARTSGMQSLAGSASTIVAPLLAGVLIATVGIVGVMIVDIVTFVIALATFLFVFIPSPPRTEAGQEGQGSLWREALYGFRYMLDRPSLLGMQFVFFMTNLVFSFSLVLLAPLILARTGNDEVLLGTVQSMMGVGGVVGGLLLSAWGGFRRRVHGVFLGMVFTGVLGLAVLGVGRGILIWAAGAFASSFFLPLVNGSNQAIWQAKVAPDVQGRVFAVRRLIAQITAPVGMLLAGPLADQVFEPLMAGDSPLAQTMTPLVGSGPGAGIGLIFVITGLLSVFTGLFGYAVPVIRDIEEVLPDHDAVAPAAPTADGGRPTAEERVPALVEAPVADAD